MGATVVLAVLCLLGQGRLTGSQDADEIAINDLGSQIIDRIYANDESKFLLAFRNDTDNRPTTGAVIPDYVGKPSKITFIAGVGPADIQDVMMGWLEQYKLYRAPFTEISTNASVLTRLDESKTDAFLALQEVTTTPDVSFVVSAVDRGIEGDPDTKHGNLLYANLFRLPILTSTIVIVYNLPEYTSTAAVPFRLSLQQIADILRGNLKTWSDISLTVNNPWLLESNDDFSWSAAVPDPPITIAIRKGISGELQWLLATLWDEDFRTGGKQIQGWSENYSAKNFFNKNLNLQTLFSPATYVEYETDVQVLGGTLSTPYRICISYLRDAKEHNATFADIETWYGNGQYATASMQAVNDHWTYWQIFMSRPKPYKDPPSCNCTFYPLICGYFIYIKKTGSDSPFTSNPSCAKAVAVLRFIRYIYTAPEIMQTWVDRSWPYIIPSGPMSAFFVQQMREPYRKLKGGRNSNSLLMCQNDRNETVSTWNELKAQILLEGRMIAVAEGLATWELILIVLAIIFFCFALVLWRVIIFFRMMKRIRNMEYKIDSSDIFLILRQNETIDRYKGVIASRRMVDYHIPRSYVHSLYFGRWNAYQVMLRPCSLNIHRMDRNMKQAIIEMIDFSQSHHVGTFYGISEVKNGRYFVSNFCPYGDLRSAIISRDYLFTLNIKFSLAGDIAEGMHFLHRKGYLHGNLRSCAIHIEADLSAKVSDWEYAHLHRLQGSYFAQETRLARTLTLFEQTAFYPWLYWTAPEILQSGMLGCPAILSEAQDVYSFGIIMGEIFSEDAAFQRFQDSPYNFTPTEIITKILSGNLRPRLPPGNDAPAAVHHLLEHCWTFTPQERPNFKTIKEVILQVSSFRKPTSDLLVIESQLLADKLKHRGRKMEERYDTVSKEFHRYSHVLVPPPIWRQIYFTHTRPPLTHHEDAVLLRCTLTNLNGILTGHDPQIAMDTINIMHRIFDELIEKNGRVYRLFTDGPTVTAVGGAPFGLDLDPVHSIAQIALDYLVWTHNSRAPSHPTLRMRFGLHSGPVSAGCMDYSAAHYVLFGELTKVAYLIESSSKPSRILVSDEFNNRLKKLAKVYVKYRVIESSKPVRGYDKKTYWLIGSNYFDQQYLLHDILYGKDELDEPSDAFVRFDKEDGIIEDRHLLRTVLVPGETVQGSGAPEILDSAVIVRTLKKQHASIMRVPLQHILDAQVKHSMVLPPKLYHVPEGLAEPGDADTEAHPHHELERSLVPAVAAPPATDLTPGVQHRTDLDEETLEVMDPSGPLLQTIHLETVHVGPHRKSHDQDPVKGDQSLLFSIKSDLLSVASGEGPLSHAARLDVFRTPVFGRLLGPDDVKHATPQLEHTPVRPPIWKLSSAKNSTDKLDTGKPTSAEVFEHSLMVNPLLLPSLTLVVDASKTYITTPHIPEFSLTQTAEKHSVVSNPVAVDEYAADAEVEQATSLHHRSIGKAEGLPLEKVISVDSCEIHVFANPPTIRDSSSDADVANSLKRHIQRLTDHRKSYTHHLHSIEGFSEEFHNSRRDLNVQNIRNTELQYNDSDSFSQHPAPAIRNGQGTRAVPSSVSSHQFLHDTGARHDTAHTAAPSQLAHETPNIRSSGEDDGSVKRRHLDKEKDKAAQKKK